MQDTVAAIATPPGQGGIAVLRVSGPEAYAVAERVFRPQNPEKHITDAPGYTAMYGRFVDGETQIDSGVALFFRAPHSYTGEDVVELSCHGGEAVSRALLAACLAAGASPAPAGEFTKRAVLAGKMDLTQAEAVLDMIQAGSDRAVALANRAMEGALYKRIRPLKQQLLALAGHLAAYTDYPEEDVEELTATAFLEGLNTVITPLSSLVEGYGQGAILRRGVNAAIVGSPNVGKSTLFNLLSGFERAIVTPVAGTTRDVVREQVQIGGIPLLLSDTAGLHDTQDEIEAEGIRRSYGELEGAGLVLAVFDATMPLNGEDLRLAAACKGRPALCILNKSDLGTAVEKNEITKFFTKTILVSALQPGTKETIEEAVLEVLGLHNFDADAALLANDRQLSAATGASKALEEARNTLLEGLTLDAAGVCLQEALSYLDNLTGESTSELIINDIFSRFCVGK